MEIRHPTDEEIFKILTDLNQEFVFSKQRLLKIEDRFPGLFERSNFNNLFALYLNHIIVSFVAVKPVTVVASGRELRVYFVGLVYTNNKHRGKAFASQLMSHVQRHYCSEGFSLGILWTGTKAFYKKLGWVGVDNGLYIHCSAPAKNIGGGGNTRVEILNDHLLPQIDLFRISQLKAYVVRKDSLTFNGYHTVYPPGERLLRLVSFDENKRISGYLLGTVNQDKCLVHEISARRDDLRIKSCFLSYIHNFKNYRSLALNLKVNDSLVNELTKIYNSVDAKRTNIQMLLYKNNEILDLAKELYIPFTDRI